MSDAPKPIQEATTCSRIASDWPVDLVPDCFAQPTQLPWLPEGGLAVASEGEIWAAVEEPFKVGDAVRLVRVPPSLVALSAEQRRIYGAIEGEVFEVLALTLPGELAIGRRLAVPGGGVQAMCVPVDCVQSAPDAPSGRFSSLAAAMARRPEPAPEDDEDGWCDELAGLRRGDCARLVRLPREVRRLPSRERRLYRRLLGECFEVWALFWPDEVHLARQIESSGGLPAIEVFVMPLDCVERIEWEPEEEDTAAMAQ